MFNHFGKHFFFIKYDGNFNVYNLMAAVASVHITTQKPLDEICEALEGFAGVKWKNGNS